MTIKYSVKADEYETFTIKSNADRYINALMCKDNYFMYDDYSEEDFINAGITDTDLILTYQSDRFSVPSELQSKLIVFRREREVNQYVKKNNSRLHLMGLVSDGGVHSSLSHIQALIDLCDSNNIKFYFELKGE